MLAFPPTLFLEHTKIFSICSFFCLKYFCPRLSHACLFFSFYKQFKYPLLLNLKLHLQLTIVSYHYPKTCICLVPFLFASFNWMQVPLKSPYLSISPLHPQIWKSNWHIWGVKVSERPYIPHVFQRMKKRQRDGQRMNKKVRWRSERYLHYWL